MTIGDTRSERAPDLIGLFQAKDRTRSYSSGQIRHAPRIFSKDQPVFEIGAPDLEHLIQPGDQRSLDEENVRHILAGRLPTLIADTSTEPMGMAMPITKAASIGSHINVPIRLPDGETYGTFYCFGFSPEKGLDHDDLQKLKAFAENAAYEINYERIAELGLSERRDRISRVIDDNQMSLAFQPIWDIASMAPVGFECLARFAATPTRSPDKWFAEASETGMGVQLELEAIRMALSTVLHLLPTPFLSFNASPLAIMSDEFIALFDGVALDRLVIEITEHSIVSNYDELLAVLQPLRERGLRLAVDDAGAGYCSMRHILNMRPDFIKLDIGLTQDIDLDPARKAMARALVGFAEETGSRIVAEGVERQPELDTLRAIGVHKVQGYLLGRAMTLAEALKLCACDTDRKVH